MDLIFLHVIVRILMMLDYAAAIGDCFSTNLALKEPGVIEGNPVIAFVMRLIKDKWVLARLAFALLTIYSAVDRPDGFAVWIYLAGTLVTLFAVVSNILLIIKTRKAVAAASA